MLRLGMLRLGMLRPGVLGLAACAAVSASGAAGNATQAAGDGSALRLAVEAAYLPKFAAFVEWPPGAVASAGGTFSLCVVGRDPFGAVLDQVAAGQTVGGRPVVVRRLNTVSGAEGCMTMFVAGSPSQSASDVLALVRGSPVLTVTDLPPDQTPRGVINFVLQDGHVRFEIDDAGAAQDGLVISSKLLSLGLRVTRRAAP